MSSARTRLGCVTAALAVLLVIGLGVWGVVRRSNRRSIEVFVYLGESIQGLSRGSPVRLRGVVVGEVREIGVASDGRMIEVRSVLFWDRLVELGLIDPTLPPDPARGPFSPPGFYAYLEQVGFTDLRVLLLDFFPADRVYEFPAPADAPWARIPGVMSTPQTMKVFVETRFSGAGEAVRSGIEMVEALDAQTRDLDGQELRLQITAQLDALEALLEGPAWDTPVHDFLGDGGTGVAELRSTVAALRETLSEGELMRVEDQVNDLSQRVEAVAEAEHGAWFREQLASQRDMAADLRDQVRALRVSLVETQRWLSEFRVAAQAQADDRDSLLSGPESLLEPPPR